MVFENVGKGIDLYPAIGLRHTSESIRVNFGHTKFQYAINEHVDVQRNNVWAGIQSTPIDWDLLNGKDTSEDDEGEGGGVSGVSGGALEEERMKAPLRQLVLSYLAHHGYAKTARAFQEQCEGARRASGSGDHTMDVTSGGSGGASSPSSSLDAEYDLRTRIEVINSVLKGDVDTAIALTRDHHPSVLEREQGLMLFKLRCRKFVELILQASDALKKVQAEQAAVEEQEHRQAQQLAAYERAMADADALGSGVAMDVDDDDARPSIRTSETSTSASSPTPPPPPPTRTSRRHSPHPPTPSSLAAKAALHTAIEYGQKLEADYKTDGRAEVRGHLKRTFGVVAYADPIAAGGEVAEMAGQEARARLANELNQAILGEC